MLTGSAATRRRTLSAIKALLTTGFKMGALRFNFGAALRLPSVTSRIGPQRYGQQSAHSRIASLFLAVRYRGENTMPDNAQSTSNGKRLFAFSAVAVGTMMSILNGTIANVALATIGRAFHVDAATSVWATNGFQAPATMGLLAAAAIGQATSRSR